MHELKTARFRDEKLCAPVFEALGIDDKRSRKLRDSILKAYSNVVSGGTGHIEQLLEEFEVEPNSREYMRRTFCCLKPNSSRFTAPMFALCLWNFMTLETGGIRAPPIKKAEWVGRAYFGGIECSAEYEATQEEVFELMDATMGLSKKYDYRPKSENNRDMKVFVGNSKEYDVKKAKGILKSHLKRGKKTIDSESFIRLACKLQGMLKFSGQQHLVKRKVGGDKLWKKHQQKRKTCDEFDKVVESLRRDYPGILKPKEGSRYVVKEGTSTGERSVASKERQQIGRSTAGKGRKPAPSARRSQKGS